MTTSAPRPEMAEIAREPNDPRQLLAEIVGLLRRLLGDDGFQAAPDLILSSEAIAGWDSFKHVELLLELQARHGLDLSGHAVNQIETVGDLVAVLAQTRSDAAGKPHERAE